MARVYDPVLRDFREVPDRPSNTFIPGLDVDRQPPAARSPSVYDQPAVTQPPAVSTPETGGGGTSLSDLFAAMQSEQARLRAEALAEKKRNALETTRALLVNLGLEEEFVTGIMPDIQNIVNEGIYDGNVISARLRSTPTYKTRFKANDQRVAKGLSALTPAEYLGLERQYRQVLSEGGLPAGFYDSKEDFTQFLGNDISVNELTQRVGLAQSVVQTTDSTIRDQLNQYYGVGTGDLTAFFLDPNRAKTALQRKVNIATVGGALARAGFDVGEDFATQLTEGVVGGSQAQVNLPETMQAAQQAAALRPLTQQVVGGEGGAIAERDLLSAQIGGDVMAARDMAREQERRLAEYRRGGSLAATQEGVVGLRRSQR
jgi:uncharacterized small protein (DUF1192 family)